MAGNTYLHNLINDIAWNDFSQSSWFNNYTSPVLQVWNNGINSVQATTNPSLSQTTPETVVSNQSSPSLSAWDRVMLRRQTPQTKYKYSDAQQAFNNALNDNVFTKEEAALFGRDFGITDINKFRKVVLNTIDGKKVKSNDIAILNNFWNGLEKNYYIKDNKVFGEGDEGWDQDYYTKLVADNPNGGFYGTDRNKLISDWNNKLTEARADTSTMTFDPITGTIKYKFNGGEHELKNASDDVKNKIIKSWQDLNKNKIRYDYKNNKYYIDGDPTNYITNTDWMDQNTKEDAELWAYQDAVNERMGTLELSLLDKYNVSNIEKTIGLIDGWNKDLSHEAQVAKFNDALINHLSDFGKTSMRNRVTADALLGKLKAESESNNTTYKHSLMNVLDYNEGSRMKKSLALRNGQSDSDYFTNLHKSGGILKAGWGAILGGKDSTTGKVLDSVLDFTPLVGSINRITSYGYKKLAGIETDENEGRDALISLGFDALGPMGRLLGKAGKAVLMSRNVGKHLNKNMKIADRMLKTTAKRELDAIAAKKAFDDFKLANPRNHGNEFKRLQKEADKAIKLAEQSKSDAARVLDYSRLKIRGPKGKSWYVPRKRDLITGGIKGSILTSISPMLNYEQEQEQTMPVQATSTTQEGYSNEIPSEVAIVENPTVTNSDYNASRFNDNYIWNERLSAKQGGILKMNKINYFQEGGAMVPQQAAPAQGGEQDIQQQIIQLVQAAMQGDQKATETINQIMQAAQQGDQQAVQLAQMIQEVAQQMQGQAQAARMGAKLSYIKSLKSGCPEGTTPKYFRKGGNLCKECVENQKNIQIQEKQPENNTLSKFEVNYKNYIRTEKPVVNQNQEFKVGGKMINKDKNKSLGKIESNKCGKKMKKCAPGAELNKTRGERPINKAQKGLPMPMRKTTGDLPTMAVPRTNSYEEKTVNSKYGPMDMRVNAQQNNGVLQNDTIYTVNPSLYFSMPLNLRSKTIGLNEDGDYQFQGGTRIRGKQGDSYTKGTFIGG